MAEFQEMLTGERPIYFCDDTFLPPKYVPCRRSAPPALQLRRSVPKGEDIIVIKPPVEKRPPLVFNAESKEPKDLINGLTFFKMNRSPESINFDDSWLPPQYVTGCQPEFQMNRSEVRGKYSGEEFQVKQHSDEWRPHLRFNTESKLPEEIRGKEFIPLICTSETISYAGIDKSQPHKYMTGSRLPQTVLFKNSVSVEEYIQVQQQLVKKRQRLLFEGRTEEKGFLFGPGESKEKGLLFDTGESVEQRDITRQNLPLDAGESGKWGETFQKGSVAGSYLTPFCKCSRTAPSLIRVRKIESWLPLPVGALEEHRPHIVSILRAYKRQMRQSHCFDIDDYPGLCPSASVAPLRSAVGFSIPMELANHAIHKYNEQTCNVYKYKVLKIEKLNYSASGPSDQFWMTVKALNLTLVTPIETFQIHAGLQFLNDEDEVIYCCRQKEEAIAGLSCDVCFGKHPFHRAEKSFENLDLWDDDNSIPKGASKEHREAFRKIYERYSRQISKSKGYDIDVYPGDTKLAVYIPYLDFEKEADLLRELANHAIQYYNTKETSIYKYKLSYIEKVNYLLAEYREFLMTVKVINMTLRTPLETFEIHAYKGPYEENIVRDCRKRDAGLLVF